MNLNYMLINNTLEKSEKGEIPQGVVIFGAGKNGIFLNKYLKNSGIKVTFFCDNDLQKQGTKIEGVSCISVNELYEYGKDVMIFVSPNNSEQIIKDLKKYKFNYIIDAVRRDFTDSEQMIYNHGERLIFGVTHNIEEDIRHRSSYLFFKKIIELDIIRDKNNKIEIVDLGCGVGHGCEVLSQIKNSRILGVDISQESLKYASQHYCKKNIQYKQANLIDFAENMIDFDYVVSRGVLEHITNGLSVALKSKWTKRLIFDVPYDEVSSDNSHHIITSIREEDFEQFPNAEIFYQDASGVIYNRLNKPSNPNMIICICSIEGLPKVAELIKFPVPQCELDRSVMKFTI